MKRRAFITTLVSAAAAVAARQPSVQAPVPLNYRDFMHAPLPSNPLFSGAYPDWHGMAIYRWEEINRP